MRIMIGAFVHTVQRPQNWPLICRQKRYIFSIRPTQWQVVRIL